jgi:hypothetical protein
MSLAEAIDTLRIPRIAGFTGDRTTVVTIAPVSPAISPDRT